MTVAEDFQFSHLGCTSSWGWRSRESTPFFCSKNRIYTKEVTLPLQVVWTLGDSGVIVSACNWEVRENAERRSVDSARKSRLGAPIFWERILSNFVTVQFFESSPMSLSPTAIRIGEFGGKIPMSPMVGTRLPRAALIAFKALMLSRGPPMLGSYKTRLASCSLT